MFPLIKLFPYFNLFQVAPYMLACPFQRTPFEIPANGLNQVKLSPLGNCGSIEEGLLKGGQPDPVMHAK